METALHSLIGYIEKSTEYDNFNLTAFLDIKGAFNNVNPGSITAALVKLRLDSSKIGFVTELLNNRIIRSKIGSTTVEKQVNRCTPRGVSYLLFYGMLP